jgi:putative addiction module killer protein
VVRGCGRYSTSQSRCIVRLEQGNLSNVKSVGEGVLEYRINFGPGYRVYFGGDGDVLLIVLTGGTQRDIRTAIELWTDYRHRKRRRQGMRG